MKHLLLLLSLISVALISCSSKHKPETGTDNDIFSYAENILLVQQDKYATVKIQAPYKNAKKGLTYVFYPRNQERPNVKADAYIPVPVKSIVCTSTTHIPLLDYLDETNALVGFPTTDYISSEQMRARVDSGKVVDLGIDNALNIERLIELNPELVMAYTMTGDYGQLDKIQQAGIPVLINAEYMEPNPLGRAEWIKLAGMLFGKEDIANSVFNSIAENYNKTKAQVKDLTDKPTVLSGIMYSDTWYLPGGQNYAATLLADAGYDYLWSKDSTEGFLSLSYETVLDRANNADYWLGVGSYETLKEMGEANERYTYFKAFKTEQVYSYNKRIGAKGGSEFLELGYLRPDLILKDLVKIAHPEVLPQYELYFYFQLPKE